MEAKTKKKAERSWIEIVYRDKDGIDWAKDRLIEDKINDVLAEVGIKCKHGNCETGAGITIDSGERDIVFEVPADQEKKAIKAIKDDFEKLNIKPKDLKIRSGPSSEFKEGGQIETSYDLKW